MTYRLHARTAAAGIACVLHRFPLRFDLRQARAADRSGDDRGGSQLESACAARTQRDVEILGAAGRCARVVRRSGRARAGARTPVAAPVGGDRGDCARRRAVPVLRRFADDAASAVRDRARRRERRLLLSVVCGPPRPDRGSVAAVEAHRRLGCSLPHGDGSRCARARRLRGVRVGDDGDRPDGAGARRFPRARSRGASCTCR